MRYHSWLLGLAAGLWLGGTAAAAEYPAPREADWVAHDFHFHTGETVPELRLHYPARHGGVGGQHADAGFRR
jgi:hypothetical protein